MEYKYIGVGNEETNYKHLLVVDMLGCPNRCLQVRSSGKKHRDGKLL